jgi:hypothetical protein
MLKVVFGKSALHEEEEIVHVYQVSFFLSLLLLYHCAFKEIISSLSYLLQLGTEANKASKITAYDRH